VINKLFFSVVLILGQNYLAGKIILPKDSCTILVPNITGPHCETNDEWVIRSTCKFKEFKIVVCDRWGQKMHQQDSLGKYNVIDWDFFDAKVTQQTYFWLITYKVEGDESIRELQGNVLILR